MKHHLPAIYHSEDLVAEGGLMSYGPNVIDEFRRAASYVDKILKGAMVNLPRSCRPINPRIAGCSHATSYRRGNGKNDTTRG